MHEDEKRARRLSVILTLACGAGLLGIFGALLWRQTGLEDEIVGLEDKATEWEEAFDGLFLANHQSSQHWIERVFVCEDMLDNQCRYYKREIDALWDSESEILDSMDEYSDKYQECDKKLCECQRYTVELEDGIDSAFKSRMDTSDKLASCYREQKRVGACQAREPDVTTEDVQEALRIRRNGR